MWLFWFYGIKIGAFAVRYYRIKNKPSMAYNSEGILAVPRIRAALVGDDLLHPWQYWESPD